MLFCTWTAMGGTVGMSAEAGDVRSWIAAALKVPVEQVHEDLEFQGIPAWDSMGHVSLIIEIESRLGIVIEPDDITRLTSVGAIRAFVASKG
jgi:acyl carrier protein